MPTTSYKQPKPVHEDLGSGYPQTGIGKNGVMVKGRWPSGTKMKQYSTMRGTGAATKGKKFLSGRSEAEE